LPEVLTVAVMVILILLLLVKMPMGHSNKPELKLALPVCES
jgi:hypothetical protein